MRSFALAVGSVVLVLSAGCEGDTSPVNLEPRDAGEIVDAGSQGDAGTLTGDPFRDGLLVAHNAVRAGASPTPAPPLPSLTWSTSAEARAQSWADKCQWFHNPNARPYGENLFASTDLSTTPDQVVAAWASEAQHYDYASNTCASGQVCGHYTQVVWRNTTEVGCAKQDCTTGSPFGGGTWQFWVCNYAPAGNFVGQRPY